MKIIKIISAKSNNLKNVDLNILPNSITCVIGRSGSGKTTMFFNVLKKFSDIVFNPLNKEIFNITMPNVVDIVNIRPVISIPKVIKTNNNNQNVSQYIGVNKFIRDIYNYHLKNKDLLISNINNIIDVLDMKEGKIYYVRMHINSIYGKKMLEYGIDRFMKKDSNDILDVKSDKMYSDINAVVYKFQSSNINKLIFENIISMSLKSDLIQNINIYDFDNKNIIAKIDKGISNKDLKCDNCISGKSCDVCFNTKLHEGAILTKVHDKNMNDVFNMKLKDVVRWYEKINANSNNSISYNILKSAAYFLPNITLKENLKDMSISDMKILTLSKILQNNITDTVYLFDELSYGINAKYMKDIIMPKIKDISNHNSVIMIEHNPEIILMSDNIIEFGPVGGKNGGYIISEGPTNSIQSNTINLFKSLLQSMKIKNNQINQSTITKPILKSGSGIKIKHKNETRKYTDISIYQSSINSIYGCDNKDIKGIYNFIIQGTDHELKNQESDEIIISYDSTYQSNNMFIKNAIKSSIDINVILEDHHNSFFASYIDIMKNVRNMFAMLPESQMKGYNQSFFSFNSKTGMCQYCKGKGYHKSDSYAQICNKCNGAKFNDSILQIKLYDKNIHEIISMEIEDAYKFFKNKNDKIERTLKYAHQIGLGYITMNYGIHKMSYGELRRLQICSILSKMNKNSIAIIEKPFDGLHVLDMQETFNIMNDIKDKMNVTFILMDLPECAVHLSDNIINIKEISS